ncbi:hypothetical protein D3C74_389510 [compost metagenome]
MLADLSDNTFDPRLGFGDSPIIANKFNKNEIRLMTQYIGLQTSTAEVRSCPINACVHCADIGMGILPSQPIGRHDSVSFRTRITAAKINDVHRFPIFQLLNDIR